MGEERTWTVGGWKTKINWNGKEVEWIDRRVKEIGFLEKSAYSWWKEEDDRYVGRRRSKEEALGWIGKEQVQRQCQEKHGVYVWTKKG